MEIYLSDQQQDLTINHEQVKLLVKSVIEREGVSCDEVSINFVTSEVISELHLTYFDDACVTDCISFPIDCEELPEGQYRILGEIFVCPYKAIEYSKKNKKDPYHEISLYIVHGLLHLMGYDDIDPNDRRKIRAAERKHMTYLNEQGLLLHDTKIKKTMIDRQDRKQDARKNK